MTPTGTATATATSTSSVVMTPTATSSPTATATQGATATPTATASPGAITLRSTGSTATTSSQVVITTPAGVQPNDLMIAQIAVRGGSATTIIPPAGWTLVLNGRANQRTTQAQGIYMHWVPSSPPEPSTYTWTFTSGNDAASGIVAYTGVSTVTPIDASAGQGNASSKNITAPTITVPAGDTSDRLVGFFSLASGAVTVTVPTGMNKLWSFPATGFGIAVAAADVTPASSGATGSKVATATAAAANVGALIALFP